MCVYIDENHPNTRYIKDTEYNYKFQGMKHGHF